MALMKIHKLEKIIVETVSLCNLKCKVCSLSVSKKAHTSCKRPPFMDLKDIKRILDEAHALNPNVVFYPQFQGEPLLHKDILQIIKYAHDLGIKRIILSTNGVLLDEQMSENLFKAGLSDIYINADALTKEIYEDIRCGAEYETVYRNIFNCINMRNKVNKNAKIIISFNIFEKNRREEREFIKLWLPLVNRIDINNMLIRNKTVLSRINSLKRPLCKDLFKYMVVLANGDAVPCYHDYECKLIMGNVLEASLKEVWEGEKYNELRILHLQGGFDEVNPCRECYAWQGYVSLDEKMEENKFTKIFPFHKSIYNQSTGFKDYVSYWYKKFKKRYLEEKPPKALSSEVDVPKDQRSYLDKRKDAADRRRKKDEAAPPGEERRKPYWDRRERKDRRGAVKEGYLCHQSSVINN